MIGESGHIDDALEAVPPPDAASDACNQSHPEPDMSADADGPSPSASAPHPFAGLFDMAIEAIVALAANFARDRLSRMVHGRTSSADSEAKATPTEDAPAAASSPHRKDGLLLVVAAAAISTTLLWYYHEKQKKSDQ